MAEELRIVLVDASPATPPAPAAGAPGASAGTPGSGSAPTTTPTPPIPPTPPPSPSGSGTPPGSSTGTSAGTPSGGSVDPRDLPWVQPASRFDYEARVTLELARQLELEKERSELHKARLKVDAEYRKAYDTPVWASPASDKDYAGRAALETAQKEDRKQEWLALHRERLKADAEYARDFQKPDWAAPADDRDLKSRVLIERDRRAADKAEADALHKARWENDPEYRQKSGNFAAGAAGNVLAGLGVGGAGGKMANLGLNVAGEMGVDLSALMAVPGVNVAVAAVQAGKAMHEEMLKTIDGMGDKLAAAGRLDAGGVGRSLNKSLGDYSLDPFGLIKPFDTFAKVNEQLFKFIDALDQTSKQLARFHGGLAASEAMANVAQIKGDIRRSQMLGDELSEFTRAKSDLSQSGQDLLATLIKPLIPIVTRFLRGAVVVVDVLSVILDDFMKGVQVGMQMTTDLLKPVKDLAEGLLPVLQPLIDVIRWLREKFAKKRDDPIPWDLANLWANDPLRAGQQAPVAPNMPGNPLAPGGFLLGT